ncbi:hypothetical protein LEP1GSC050_2008 [Leptospira broomii serovar Hurstbridge str. 5399]|uniref:Uncharacterized protein n=1 Tax=Leptospira broomii serovar Hurstbridge str. 5399 TaxID=1049789 RepID=T0F9J8_9LEPT|nr:hypothetical protein LEP1GSC050_2008 [Leptospira broomii serovar Hurstbridge str. 5399]
MRTGRITVIEYRLRKNRILPNRLRKKKIAAFFFLMSRIFLFPKKKLNFRAGLRNMVKSKFRILRIPSIVFECSSYSLELRRFEFYNK